MRAEVGTHLVQGALDPRVHVQRVQVVQQQQAFHQRVLEQAVQDGGSRRAFRAERGHDVAQPVAVQSEQQPDQFLGGPGGRLPALGLQDAEQLLDPCPDLPCVGHPPRLCLDLTRL